MGRLEADSTGGPEDDKDNGMSRLKADGGTGEPKDNVATSWPTLHS